MSNGMRTCVQCAHEVEQGDCTHLKYPDSWKVGGLWGAFKQSLTERLGLTPLVVLWISSLLMMFSLTASATVSGGQYYDRETPPHFNNFKDYGPTAGRYIQADPIGLEGGLNVYGYANQNPLTFIDPTGESGVIVLPRPIFVPRPVPMPAEAFDPALPIPNVESIPGSPKDPFGEYCRSLARKIANTKDEIYNKRYPDLELNPKSLPQRIGPGEKMSETVRGHEKLLNRRLRDLRKLEDEFTKNCGC